MKPIRRWIGGRKRKQSSISQSPTRTEPRSGEQKQHRKGLRVYPLGGFEQIGRNCFVVDVDDDLYIIDLGLQFPEEDMLGIDYVLPDISYLQDKKDRIRGIFLTHGHLDHIGGIPYLLPKLGFPPIYGAPLTIGFVEKQLVEFKQTKQAKSQNRKVNDHDHPNHQSLRIPVSV